MNLQQSTPRTSVPTITNPMMQLLDNDPKGQIRVGHAVSTISERRLAKHEHLFVDGDVHTHLYKLLEGVFGVYKLLADGRRQMVTFCYPGDLIGLDHADYFSHHAEALSEARVRCIPKNAVNHLIDSEPGFGQALLQTLSTEISDSRSQLLSLGRKSALEKLATFLLDVSRRNARQGQDAELLNIPMTRSDIADYLGLTIETVSRNFTRLKVSRAIRVSSYSRIQILNVEKLKSMAEEESVSLHAVPIPN